MSNNLGKEIKEKILSNDPSLHLGRVPRPTYLRFVEWSKKEFCQDYGMAFKHLFDFYFGLIPSGIEHVEQEIITLRKEVQELKDSLLKEKKPVKRRLDGTEVKENGNI